ncbi:MAG TPA: thermonuclease family protein [Pyrinomonadaceae bacterium]|nr:thermonuclease family protein [Pyrinomonadaceae bacterium]
MNRPFAFRFLAVLSLLPGLAAAASAATLQARVIEVRSGNTIIVTNINRPVSVRLKAIVPPEVGQPFNDVARDHLKVLVLDKNVTVEYTHFADNYLEARVFLNNIDIGSQMLRDGVAWYDHAFDYELKQADRDLYAQCEAAARAEKRGLWQDAAALAPWEYRRLQTERLTRITDPSPIGNLSQPSKPKTRTSLSNDDVMRLVMGSGPSSSGMSAVRPIVANGDPERWVKYTSDAGHFSVTLPSNAVEGSDTLPDPSTGGTVGVNFVTGGSNLGIYFALCAKGPNSSGTDESVRDQFIKGLISGMNYGATRDGHGTVDLKPERAVNVGGYPGMQYRLSSPGVVGTARVFTKQAGDQRELYVVMTLSRPDSEALSSQFIKSFAITR